MQAAKERLAVPKKLLSARNTKLKLKITPTDSLNLPVSHPFASVRGEAIYYLYLEFNGLFLQV